MENWAESILNWRNARLEDRETSRKVMFSITTPKINQEESEVLNKVQALFNKYGVKMGSVDTVSGAFNLNRDWLQTCSDVECFVEFCGVYPIYWDVEDVAELARMDTDGEIIILADWHVGDEYIPNN